MATLTTQNKIIGRHQKYQCNGWRSRGSPSTSALTRLTHKDKVITFIDTPGTKLYGHENRGARIADIRF